MPSTYTYPDGLTVSIPDHLSHIAPFRLEDLDALGFDPLRQVVVNLDRVCRGRSGQYVKPPKCRWPYPARDEYREAICSTWIDEATGEERLCNPHVVTDAELAAAVTVPYGCTWETSLFGPGLVGKRRAYWPIARNTRYWLGSQIVATDVDGGMPWSEAREVLARHGLHPTFAYDSGSCRCGHGDHDRYRVVVVLDEVSTDAAITRRLARGLTEMLGGDRSSADLTRVFYGGKSVILSDPGRRVSRAEFEESLWSAKVPGYSPGTNLRSARSRHRASFGLDSGAAIVGAGHESERGGGHIVDSEYENGIPTRDSNTSAENVLDSEGVDGPPESGRCTPSPRLAPASHDCARPPAAVRIPELRGRLRGSCGLWRDLEAGVDPAVGVGDPRWLHYRDLLHVFSNLTAVRGGHKLFREVLRRVHEVHPDWEQYDHRSWGRDKGRTLSGSPSRCDADSCPHAPSCPSGGLTIVDAARGTPGWGPPRQVEPRPVVSLEAGQERLEAEMAAALSATDSAVHGVRAPTGLGKTETYVGHVARHGGRYLIAVPTHALAREVQRRLLEVGVQAGRRPEVPLDGADAAVLRHLYDLGAHGAAARLVREQAVRVPAFHEYLRECDEAEAHDVLIVTHAALPHLLAKHGCRGRRVVVDEDPLPTLIRSGQVSKSVLAQMLTPIAGEPDGVGRLVDDLWQEVCRASEDRVVSLHPVADELEAAWHGLAKRAIAHVWGDDGGADRRNVLDLFRAERMVVQGGVVSHARLLRLPEDVGVVVTSATLDPEVCRRAFGDRLVVHEVPDVESAGRLVQHAGSSVSRQALERMTEAERQAFASRVGGAPTITYAGWKGLFENPSAMHFGNVEGLDALGGSSLNVVGTWNLNPVALHLMAAVLGRAETELARPRLATNRHVGFVWRDFCYADDPILLSLQNYTRHSMLQQSIGRARLVRNDVTVEVWTNVPVPGAEVVADGPS